MLILLDESLPRDLAPLIADHEVVTVQAAGWSSIKNGKLLALAAAQFEVFVTADRNIEFQQNLATLPIAIVVLRARNNRIEALQPLLPELLQLLNPISPRTLRKVGA
jgi:predicted nuclease of predicted toxin-antitoxin system